MRITQGSGFLLSFARDVASGRILPAAIQRPYRWQKDDVEALCDSIVSGFPIGGFLLWAPGSHLDLGKVARPRLGPISANPLEGGSATRPHMLLLDGQNRLASLAWMMVHDWTTVPSAAVHGEEHETWLGEEVLVLDYETRLVRFVPRAEADVGLRMPAWTLISLSSSELSHRSSAFMREKMFGDWADSTKFAEAQVDDFMKLYDDVRNRFMNARVTETIIEDATEEEAAHAFMRICRVGVPMSEEDFRAAIRATSASASA